MCTLDTTRSGLWTGASNSAGGAGAVLPHFAFTQALGKPVTPDLVTRYDIEFRPMLAALKPGHCLRLVLGTGDLPHLMPNTTEGPCCQVGTIRSGTMPPPSRGSTSRSAPIRHPGRRPAEILTDQPGMDRKGRVGPPARPTSIMVAR